MARLRVCAGAVVALLLATAAAAAAQPAADGVDIQCVISKCGAQALACAADADCQEAQACNEACLGGADPACTNACFFKHPSKAFADVAVCAFTNGCTQPQLAAQACPDLSNATLAADFNVSMLADVGVMFVSAGADPTFDCFDCQILEFTPLANGSVSTTWEGRLGGERRAAAYALDQTAQGVLTTAYNLFDMPVKETYYVLDYTPDGSHILYFFCGNLLGSEYYGAQVYSREPAPLTPELADRFAEAVVEAGLQDYLQVDEFCTPSYNSCPNLSA